MNASITPSSKETVQLQGYSFSEKLYEGSRTVVYRGLRQRDQRPVVVKFLKDEFPSFNELVQFSNQYTIAKDLDLTTIVKPLALVPCGKASALVMEDFGGCDLRQFLILRSDRSVSEKANRTNKAAKPDLACGHSAKPKMGDSLSEIILFLQIAIQVAEALEGLFDARIIHKDIKPANILIHPQSHRVKLIDFSIASALPREMRETRDLAALEGTIAYLSPEQTGRMNRGIDYRSDFYSFGVTCYELLTGQLPFAADDPMEVVHGHLARQAVPPTQLCNGTLPAMVSSIVLKLMAKNAENRYQSAFGLKHDLTECLDQLKATGEIKSFTLGQRDVSDYFLLPEKLYGRQQEVTQLLAAFHRVSQGNTELMLIAGSSGAGKTAIVNEVQKPITCQRGYFINGKYDQLQRNVSLSAFIRAFRELVRLLLSESDSQIEQRREQILAALGRNAQVLIEVIPELEGIVGRQPPATVLSPQAAENRFNLLLQKFVQVFTNDHHPLVIFLDDMQWADSASLNLLQLLLQDDGHLLIIGAYRDNEVCDSHPLMLTLEDIRAAHSAKQQMNQQAQREILAEREPETEPETESERENERENKRENEKTKSAVMLDRSANVNLLVLSPLSLPDVNQLVADTLRSTLSFAQPLAEFIYQKTHGNPFFSAQYLIALQAEDKITFDENARHWQYDLALIKAIFLGSDNVQTLMHQRLQKLTASTQAVLRTAACIGAQFDLATLMVVTERPIEAIITDLGCALQEGLIVQVGDVPTEGLRHCCQSLTLTNSATLEAINPHYRFVHDRIQQAAYGLIDAGQQAAAHRVIGQRLAQQSYQERGESGGESGGENDSENGGENRLFDIVNHLNQAIELIESDAERDRLITLNFSAAQRAKAATAYTSAFEYLTVGIRLLPANSWQTHYDLTLKMHHETAEIAYLTGQLVAMQQSIDQVLQQANTLLDKTSAYETQIQATIAQNQFLHGIEITLQLLAQLGVFVPRQPEPAEVQVALRGIAVQLSYQPIETLIDLPEMEDPESLIIIRLLTKAVSAAYIAHPEVLPLLVCMGIDRCLKFGNSPLSAFLYGWYGAILCGPCEDIHQGYKMGNLALKLLEKIPAREIQTRVVALVHSLIYPWRTHIKDSLRPLKENYQVALESGDIEYAAWSISGRCHYAYLAGQNLEKLTHTLARDRNSVSRLHQDAAFNYLDIYQQVVLNLLGQGATPTQLEGEAYRQTTMRPIHLAANDMMGLAYLHINQGILAYLFAKPLEAQKNFDDSLKYLQGIMGSQWLPALFFYDSLACLAIADDAQNQMSRVVVNQEKMRTWARLSPENHLHRWHLVEAERCRLTSNKAEAVNHYDQAIALATASGFVQEEAIACELAAQFYLLWGKGRIAQSYMLDAYYAYGRWGARAKVADLESRYALLLEPALRKKQQNLSSTDTILAYANNLSITTSNAGISEVIDLTTLRNTAQILSSEIELEKLLAALLDAVIQNAGADKCVLIMPKEEAQAEKQWVIEAFCDLSGPPILLQSKALKPGELLPVSLVNQVRHTGEPAVIFNAAVHATLTVDPYVLRHRPKSVLCAPLLNQGKLIAILYLENNLTIGAFTDHRVEVLNLICTQAAISLENARLYHQAQRALAELQTSHMQLVQSEKMSALGNLVAGVAHEINNPVNFLKGNLQPALSYVKDLFYLLDMVIDNEPRETILEEIEEINLEFIREDLPNLLHSMTFGISRIQDISTSLRTFSRADKAYKTAFDIHEGLDSTLLILQHRLLSGPQHLPIQVVKNYANLPEVCCFAGQLNQVFMNLIANAIEAIDEHVETAPAMSAEAAATAQPLSSGVITITTALVDAQTVQIAIADNGPGMTEEVKARVFDHLFTTKPVGKGTGLGLAISYDIVTAQHNGTLTVSSEVGVGTEFVITLPIEETC